MNTKTTTPPTPRNAYSPRISVVSPCGEGAAQQQFKEDCDVNTIMQRYQKTGAIDHVSKHQTEYGFASPLDYHQSMNIIAQADSMFNDLPSSVRNEFNNNPQAFLEFVQDAKNADRAKKLGLALTDKAAAEAAEIAAAAELSGTAKTGESGDSPQDAGTSPETPQSPTQ